MVKSFGCTKQFLILQLPIPCCISLIMVTITRHVFIDIFQTEHFATVKFAMDYEKNVSFLVMPKSPNVGKKVQKIRRDSFKIRPCRDLQKRSRHGKRVVEFRKLAHGEVSHCLYFISHVSRPIILIKRYYRTAFPPLPGLEEPIVLYLGIK